MKKMLSALSTKNLSLPIPVDVNDLPDYSIVKVAGISCPSGCIMVDSEGVYNCGDIPSGILIEFADTIFYQTTVLVKGESNNLSNMVECSIINSSFLRENNIKILKTGREQ